MPSALIAELAAPIHEVAAQVGPGWSDQGDPAAALAEVRDLLADVSAATRGGWSRTTDGWSGTGADSAADFVSAAAHTADRFSVRIDELRSTTAGAADAVARARSRLRDIINRFEDRAATLEPRLDEPWAVDELRAEAQRALDEAVGVVDGLRTELDGHAAAVAAPPPPPAAVSAAAPVARPGLRHRPASVPTPLGAPLGAGSIPGSAYGGLPPADTGLSALPVADPEQFGDGVAVTLPDGSNVTAPNAVAADAVRHALTQLGVPYVWGGTSPGVGLDCSGLTQWAYHEAGLNLPRLAQEQDLGATVNQSSLRPGDLAVWDGHVAMVVGNGMMIEAGDPVSCHRFELLTPGRVFRDSGGLPRESRYGNVSAHLM